MRIHVIGCPAYPSIIEKPIHCFGIASYYLTTYLYNKGHEVHYYGYEQSTAKCTKKWICGDKEHYKKHYKTDKHDTVIDYTADAGQEGDKTFVKKQIEHLISNYKDNELILCHWSTAIEMIHYHLLRAKIKFKIIDAHVGHHTPSKLTQFHVFSSYANREFAYGKYYIKAQDTNWRDTVIAPFCSNEKDFKFKKKKKGYFLFMARLIREKGLEVFINLAKHFPDKKFIISGQAAINRLENFRNKEKWNFVNIFEKEILPTLPDNIEYVGLLDQEKRKEYLSNATAIISPTFYSEPFGLTVVEANLSGTPAIATDSGAYVETIVNGYNGFRCYRFSDFVDAINNIDKIKAEDCKKYAKRFTIDALGPKWDKYLEEVNIFDWYHPHKKPE